MAVDRLLISGVAVCLGVSERSMELAGDTWRRVDSVGNREVCRLALERLWEWVAAAGSAELGFDADGLYSQLPLDGDEGPLSAVPGASACVGVVRPLIEVGALIGGRSSLDGALVGAKAAGGEMALELVRAAKPMVVEGSFEAASRRLDEVSSHRWIKREASWFGSDRHAAFGDSSDLLSLRSVNASRAVDLLHDFGSVQPD